MCLDHVEVGHDTKEEQNDHYDPTSIGAGIANAARHDSSIITLVDLIENLIYICAAHFRITMTSFD